MKVTVAPATCKEQFRALLVQLPCARVSRYVGHVGVQSGDSCPPDNVVFLGDGEPPILIST